MLLKGCLIEGRTLAEECVGKQVRGVSRQTVGSLARSVVVNSLEGCVEISVLRERSNGEIKCCKPIAVIS
jgi:hypothetical protein